MSEQSDTHAEVWATLSEIDCTAHVKKKGKLDYLPWAWAWGILMEHYPRAYFKFQKERRLDNGTVEVRCTVTIPLDIVSGMSRSMWLPVMDYQNKSIENPTTREISDSRMRCLVKCLALFGLGHSLYAGEDVPDSDQEIERLLRHNAVLRDTMPSVLAVKEYLMNDEYYLAYEALAELEQEEIQALWIAPTKGGIFTPEERGKMKSDPWNDARKAYHGLEDD